MVQRTLSIVKPDAVANNAIGGVLAVLVLTSWTLLVWRRRERARLGEN